MSSDEYLRKLQKHIDTMPALPISVSKVLEIADNPATSPVDLNKVISLDPVLMARVLKLINSAYYGVSSKVNSLVRAIIMLGINTVKNLALSTAVLDTLGRKSDFRALDIQAFWRHSLGVGVTAKLLAKKRGIASGRHEEYFIAGLLHGIGKIPMNNVLSELYVEAMSIADRQKMPLYAAEREIFGFDHSFVGDQIGQAWNLGDAILDTISYQQRPTEYDGQYADIVNTVHTAVYFVTVAEIGFSGDRYPEPVSEDALKDLGIDMPYLDGIEDEVEREIEKAEVFLHL